MSSNRSPERTVVITDTSCFIILQKLDLIKILNDLFDTVLTTPEIAAEYGNPLPAWVEIITVSNKSLQKEFSSL